MLQATELKIVFQGIFFRMNRERKSSINRIVKVVSGFKQNEMIEYSQKIDTTIKLNVTNNEQNLNIVKNKKQNQHFVL